MSSGWKTVRVFISSTFRDMHAERDYLVKTVFPRLREWCEARRLHLVDIDLRWGLTRAEAESGKILEICLDQIDGCRPFFLCLLGDQYGWVPEGGKEDRSVTHSEIAHALVLPGGEGAAQAFFYLRDPTALPSPESLAAFSPEERQAYRAAYFTPAPAPGEADRRAALQALKNSIFERFAKDDRVFVYGCAWDSGFTDPENPLLHGRLAGLESLGERVEADIKRAITEELGAHLAALADEPDALEREQALHQAFIASRTQLHVADEAVQRAIGDYVSGASRLPCILSGAAGAGKSSALAYWVETNADFAARKKRDAPDSILLFRAVGASPLSARLPALLENLTRELVRISNAPGRERRTEADTANPPGHVNKAHGLLQRLFGKPEAAPVAAPKDRPSAPEKFPDFPDDPAKFVTLWPQFLRIAAERSPGPIIILIDGLNQLSDRFDLSLASWIPAELPENVRLLVSVADGDQAQSKDASADWLAMLRRRGFSEIRVPPLEDKRRRAIIRALPSIYSKSLDAAQTDALLANPATSNPLFLCVALQELRTFGSFERLDEAIARIPRMAAGGGSDGALDAIFNAILARLENEAERQAPGLVAALFGALAAARDGLSESEADKLLAMVLPGVNDIQRRDALQAALRQVRPYLSRRESQGVVLVTFFHRSFTTAARNRYMPDNAAMAAQHRRLAGFFDAEPLYIEAPRVNARKATELAWQRLRTVEAGAGASDGTKLLALMRDWRFLEAKCEAELLFELANEIGAAHQLLAASNPGAKHLSLIEEALRRDIHFIARHRGDYPQALFQCLWNACWWYDHPSAADYYLEPETIRPVFDGALAAWAEDYRAGKAARDSKRSWLRQLRPRHPRLGSGLRMEFNVYTNRVTSLAFSRDGRYLVTGSFKPAVVVWDLQTGDELYRIDRAGGRVLSLDVSPDGQFFAIGLDAKTSGETVLLYSLPSNQQLRILTAHRPNVDSVQFSQDGRYLLTAADDGTACVWETASGRLLHRKGEPKQPVQGGRSFPVRLLPSGDQLVLAPDGQAYLEIWNWRRQSVERRIDTADKAWRVIAVSADGSLLAGANGYSKSAFVWDLAANEKQPRQFGPHPDWVQALVFSPDGKTLLAAAGNTVFCWNVATGQSCGKIANHRAEINAVAVSPDGASVASASGGLKSIDDSDNAVRISALEQDGRPVNLIGHDVRIKLARFSPDGKYLVTGAKKDSQTTLRVWSTPAMRTLPDSPISRSAPDGIVFAPGGFATFGQDYWTVVWAISDLAHPVILKDPACYIKRVVLCPQDSSLWVTSSTAADALPTLVFDFESGRQLRQLDSSIRPWAFSSAGDVFASVVHRGGRSSDVAILDSKTLRRLAVFYDTTGQVGAVAFSPDGALLAFSRGPGQITIARWRRQEILHQLGGHPSSVKSLFFSSDGAYLTSACGHEVRLWAVASGECLAVYQGEGDAAALAGALFTAGAWPLNSGTELNIIDRVSGRSIAWAPGAWHHPSSHPSLPVWAGTSHEQLNAWRLESLGDA